MDLRQTCCLIHLLNSSFSSTYLDMFYVVSLLCFLLCCCCCFIPSTTLAANRIYNIAIVEVDWDYENGNVRNLQLLRPGGPSFQRRLKREVNSSSTSFIKAVFRRFNEDFTEQLEHPGSLGLLGPLISASPGDKITIRCRNFARFPFTIEPQLVNFKAKQEIAAFGGTMELEWFVRELGPIGDDENCILGSYHSGDGFDTGTIGPMVVCKDGFTPLTVDDYWLRNGHKMVFAMPKVFDELQSFYGRINMATERRKHEFPTINGLSKTGALFKSISLFEFPEGDCNDNLPRVLLHVFTFGGSDDFQMLSTSCGVLMNNGRSLVNSFSIYSGVSTILHFDTEDLKKENGGCFLHSLAPDHNANGMAIPLMFPRQSCPSLTPPPPTVVGEVFNLTIGATLWQYNRSEFGKCGTFLKLRFAGPSGRNLSEGLEGPTIWTSVGRRFDVDLTIPEAILAMLPGKQMALELELPSIVQLLSRTVRQADGNWNFHYSYLLKPSTIGSQYDSPCKPFIYSAALSTTNSQHNAIDTGLFGPLIICQDEELMKKYRNGDVKLVFPLVIDESKSVLSGYNGDCLETSLLFHTVNGFVGGFTNFGQLTTGSSVWWYLFSPPPLPGRHSQFHNTLTFSDEGKYHKVYNHHINGGKSLVIGSSAIIHSSGKMLEMVVGNVSGDWSLYSQLTSYFTNGMFAKFSTSGSTTALVALKAKDKRHFYDLSHYVIAGNNLKCFSFLSYVANKTFLFFV